MSNMPNLKSWAGPVAFATCSAIATALIVVATVGSRISAAARKMSDDVIEARTRQRTIEVRPLKVDDSKRKWGSRNVQAFEVRDTVAGTEWLVLSPRNGDPGIVLPLPTTPTRITDIPPEPR